MKSAKINHSRAVHLIVARGLCGAALGVSLCGCIVGNADPKAKWATTIDKKFASSEYWFNQPATEKVEARDFDVLWSACERVARNAGFKIDRYEYREGLMTTKPLVSRQFFELWKQDVADFRGQIDSDAATRRRVVHFQIDRVGDNRYVAEIKAVVEHYSMTERRITDVYEYRDAFSTHRQYETDRTDEGTPVRVDYWYAERRDEALEHALAQSLRTSLGAGNDAVAAGK